MVKTVAVLPEEQHFVLSTLSPGRAQRRLALAVVLALLVAFFITEEGPLSTIQLGRIDAFVPAYATAMFVIDSITAVLLFAQFSILRSRALLAISSGYLYTALMVIPWMLTSWLYTLWHAGFPMFVIAYALLKDADPAKRLWRGSAGAAILSSAAMTAILVWPDSIATNTEPNSSSVSTTSRRWLRQLTRDVRALTKSLRQP